MLRYSEHTAAVKAIAWSPHVHGLLASGGGTADGCIRFWRTTTNSHLRCIDTGSSVICFCHLYFLFNWIWYTHGIGESFLLVVFSLLVSRIKNRKTKDEVLLLFDLLVSQGRGVSFTNLKRFVKLKYINISFT
jgi:WD40 repeat protein